MRRILVLAVLALSIAAPASSRAATCDVDVECLARREALEAACPCASFDSARAYRRCVRTALARTGGCRRGLACLARTSTCGRPRAVVCCRADGKRTGAVRRHAGRCTSGRKPGVVCAGPAQRLAVDDVCTDQGACRTTPPEDPPPAPPENPAPTRATLDLTIVERGGACGLVSDDTGSLGGPVPCGGIYVGASDTGGVLPSGTTSRFLLDCLDDGCSVSATTAAAAGADCTTTGCPLGAPVPIETGGGTARCLVNTLAAPATGLVDRATGSVSLSLDVATTAYLVGSGGLYSSPDSTCPVCQDGGVPVVGRPGAPASGTCNGGARAGSPCTSTNPHGLTSDCLPGADDCGDEEQCSDGSLRLGTVALALSPLATAPATRTSPDGRFCDRQNAFPGCFRVPGVPDGYSFAACRTIAIAGSPAGTRLVSGVPAAVTLASTACIPWTAGHLGVLRLVDMYLGLPGPGALSVAGTLTLVEAP